MEKNINDFIGSTGVTTDENFGQITSILAEQGKVITEKESGVLTAPGTPKYVAELVTTLYEVNDEAYELWYQVKTPDSYKGASLAYGFKKLDKTEDGAIITNN